MFAAKGTTVCETGGEDPPSEALVAEDVAAGEFDRTVQCAAEGPSVVLIWFLADAALVVVGRRDCWGWNIAEEFEFSDISINVCAET